MVEQLHFRLVQKGKVFYLKTAQTQTAVKRRGDNKS